MAVVCYFTQSRSFRIFSYRLAQVADNRKHPPPPFYLLSLCYLVRLSDAGIQLVFQVVDDLLVKVVNVL